MDDQSRTTAPGAPELKCMIGPAELGKETQDQIAAVMLQCGTKEQVKEALAYCGITQPSGDRESWDCEGEGCKVQKPYDVVFRGRLPDGSLPGAGVPGVKDREVEDAK